MTEGVATALPDSRWPLLAAQMLDPLARYLEGDGAMGIDRLTDLLPSDSHGLDLDDPVVQAGVGEWLARMLEVRLGVPAAPSAPRPPPTADGPPSVGRVYFIGHPTSGRVKIGYTARPVHIRVRELSTGASEELELLGSVRGTPADERSLHQALADHRVHGEWFAGNSTVMAAINDRLAQADHP